MVPHLGEIKTRTKVSVLPWYNDTVKGNILFVGTRAPNWPGAGSHGWREAACGLGVEVSCRWSCKKSPSHKAPSCCMWLAWSSGLPGSLREAAVLFGGSCASFQGAVAILRKSTTMGHLKTKAIISDERESAGLKVQNRVFGLVLLCWLQNPQTVLSCWEWVGSLILSKSRLALRGGRDLGDGAGQVLTCFSFCK